MTIRQIVHKQLSYTKAQNVSELMRATGLTEVQVRGSIFMLRDKDGIFVAQVGEREEGWYLSDAPLPSKELGKTRWQVGPPPYPKRSARP